MLILALLAWIYLAGCHGRFWQSGPILPIALPKSAPPVAIVVPARDEAEGIAAVITSLLTQDYPGPFRVVLVDDNSTDGTANIARALPGANRLTVIIGAPRPTGWAGKLWAVSQGVAAMQTSCISQVICPAWSQNWRPAAATWSARWWRCAARASPSGR